MIRVYIIVINLLHSVVHNVDRFKITYKPVSCNKLDSSVVKCWPALWAVIYVQYHQKLGCQVEKSPVQLHKQTIKCIQMVGKKVDDNQTSNSPRFLLVVQYGYGS